jgi:hypothetical protein
MRKIIWTFGLIAGLIVTGMMAYSSINCYHTGEFDGSLALGYATMIAAFAFIFVAIRNYRNNYNGGVISFGKAFKIGLFITLIASTMYVLVWVIEYYFFIPDWLDRYTEVMMQQAKSQGLSEVEMAKKSEEMAMYKEWYKNPFFLVLMTYFEILPVGLIVSLIAALILKRKSPGNPAVAAA